MNYREIIKINDKFQNAVNLHMDLNNFQKISEFIPTAAAVEILKSMLMDVCFNTSTRANVVIGPYGKGKSHIFLVLLGILSIRDDEVQGDLSGLALIEQLIERISEVDSDVADLIREVRENHIRILPVLVNGNYLDMKQAFLAALKNALINFGLEDVSLYTYFDAVKDVLDRWRAHYPRSFEEFIETLTSEHSMSFSEFCDGIDSYESSAYDAFCSIYPSVSSGSEFNPLTECDTVTLFRDVNEKITKDHGFNGIFIVFDEFSKYLESSIKTDITLELKLLQDIAELANRSNETQFHITCIAHKGIGEYTAHIPKRRVDPYRAVEGRFREIHFISSIESSYELIANAIAKNKEKFDEFYHKHEKSFISLRGSIEDTPFFSNNPELQVLIVEKCFPLSPLSSYALLQVCEKSAQNERTLFTFLSRKGEGLDSFVGLDHTGLELLTLEFIYDYFEPLFIKDLYNPRIKDYAMRVKSAIKRTNDDEERRFLKALGVILIIDDLEYFRANREIICTAMHYSAGEYAHILQSLVKKGIIIQKNADKCLDFAKKNSESLRLAIHDHMELNRTQINTRKELENSAGLGYVIPRRYNDEKEMTRFFKHGYITSDELLKTEVLKPFYPGDADGYVLNLLYTMNDNIEECVRKFNLISDENVILRISENPFSKAEELLERYAVCELIRKGTYIDDSDAIDELSFYRNDLEIALIEHMDHLYGSDANIHCHYMGERQTEANIGKLVSAICVDLFRKTPVINNELINKNSVSTQIKKAREKAIEFIFTSQLNIAECDLAGTTPDMTILKALRRADADCYLNEVYTGIDDFISSCEGKRKSFGRIFDCIYSKPYGVRRSLIPLLLAYRLKRVLSEATIYYNNKEVVISGDVFSGIEDKPEQYSLLIEHGSADRQEYTASLMSLFQGHHNSSDRIYNDNGIIVKAISAYLRGLPRVTIEMARMGKLQPQADGHGVSEFVAEFIKADINPRDMLFDFLPAKFPGLSLTSTFESISIVKEALDNYFPKYTSELCDEVKRQFLPGYKGSLKSALSAWFQDVSKAHKTKIFDSPIPDFMRLIEEPNGHDDLVFVNRLALLMTSFKIEDWTENSEKLFWEEISKSKDALLMDVETVVDDDQLEITIGISGETFSRSLSGEISHIGKTLFNNLETILSEYGDSISKEERARVLLELLKKQI